jgi:hypothetical protein
MSWIAGCGDGSHTTPPVTAAPPVTTTVARIEVSPSSLLLQPGGSAKLTARVVDSTGATVNSVTVSWNASSNAVSVAADGTVTAGMTVDSAVITASVGTVSAVGVTALVATIAPGAQMIADSQVVGDPVQVDSTLEPGVGSQLRMTLGGASPPAVGAIILSSESKPIGGRVVSTAANGANSDVVFEVLPLTELFTQMKLSQTYAKSELAQTFDVQPSTTVARTDGALEYEFALDTPDTPVPTPASSGVATVRQAAARSAISATQSSGQPVGYEWKVGRFDCKAQTTLAPAISFRDMAPHVVDNLGPVKVFITVDDGNFTADVQSQGSVKLVVDGEVSLGGKLSGTISCDARLFKYAIPVPPLVALVFTPVVPVFGLRANITGTLEQDDLVLGIKSEVEQPMNLGFSIDRNGTFSNSSTIDTTAMTTKFEWKLTAPQGLDSVHFTGDATAGLYVQASFTNPFLLLYNKFKPDFDPYKSLIDGFVGFHPSLALATVNEQIQDRTIKSGYAVKALAQLKVGDDLANAFGWLSRAVKLGQLILPDVKYEPTLFSQPIGSARASLRRFMPGEDEVFSVILDPTTVEPTFLGAPTVGYNVKQVEIWRKNTDGTSQRISMSEGAPGKSSFTMHWTADGAGTTNDSAAPADAANYYAIVVPNFGEDFGFRVGPTLGWLGVVQSGDSDNQEGHRVAVDTDGNVVIASISGTPLPSEKRLNVGGANEVQISKLDPNGKLIWATNIDGPGDENVFDLVMDSAGNIFLVGLAVNSPLTDGAAGANGFSAWAASFDTNGNKLWLKQWQDGIYSIAQFVALGPNRELYVLGGTSAADAGAVGGSALVPDCGMPESAINQTNADCGDLALRRLDANNGATLWSKVDARAAWQLAQGLTVDSGGNIYTATSTWADTQTQNTGQGDGYADFVDYYLELGSNSVAHVGAAYAMWNDAGDIGWRVNIKNKRQTTANGYVYTDEGPHGIVAVGGNVWTVVSSRGAFPGGTNAGGRDSALFSLNSTTGLPALVHTYGSAGDDVLTLFGPTPGGEMLMTGWTSGSLFGTNAGGLDAVAVRLASDGSLRWAQQIGGPGNDTGVGAAAGADGNVFITGFTDGLMPATLSGLPADTQLNTAGGGDDMFIAKLGYAHGTVQAPRTK